MKDFGKQKIGCIRGFCLIVLNLQQTGQQLVEQGQYCERFCVRTLHENVFGDQLFEYILWNGNSVLNMCAAMKQRCDPCTFRKLTEKKREALFEIILEQAEAYSIARVEAAEIDEIDILNARMKAMQLAIDGLAVQPELALIDGNRDHGSRFAVTAPHMTVVGGDGKSASIAAASILAKVARDRYVSNELDALYPQYRFAKHKGYGTKLHYEMLDQFGPSPAHRVTFLKKWEQRAK